MRFAEDRLETFPGRAGAPRSVHIWEPPEPVDPPMLRCVLLALHGGMAHAGDWGTPALYFRARGIATAAFDLCGHGAGKRADIPDFDIFIEETGLFLDWVRSRWPGVPVFVIGHSMGALVATRFGLAGGADVAGFILSSPYYVNAVPVPAALQRLSGVLAKLVPTMKVPLASLTDVLTHDAAITARHHRDEADGIRATEVTMRFGHALQGAQRGLSLEGWRHQLYVVLAGQDALADTQAAQRLLGAVPPHLLACRVEAGNRHENFNELNRNELFADIAAWIERTLEQRDG
ncbi:alpha/beta fold hydrolase [Pseudoduganella umbonata]|uniref:Alpha-beta hydrolase superfamily lysophospholipase n=1 Tax=Pseudoduganella umbonata TaxID=864828 RepID=A0A4P8HXL6_9BURK|nr:alpha/beta fold hydrolase [Pseudoduganella umbonata]MBB3224505.1 alpha-beta hydrolase superfamily lysophospholipase [Pseudoduganella umbonata]QCP13274.1 alpha/beta hydrolase [Pseudoduganella umbonata]